MLSRPKISMTMFQYLPSWRRWLWLLLAIWWIMGFGDRLTDYPDALSSIMIPYVWLAIVPTLIMLIHVIYPCLFTWIMLAMLFILGSGSHLYQEVKTTLINIPIKWTEWEGIKYLGTWFLLILIVSFVVWLLKPKSMT